jgi:MobA/MobL family
MAIFHLTTKTFSRRDGQSAIAAAAYRSGEKLFDEAAGEEKFYKARRERIVVEGIWAPADAPEWARDRNSFWNRAEQIEKRHDARLAREIEVGLPHELTAQQRQWLVRDFVREQFVRNGYVVDVAIHAPHGNGDPRNHHAHILVSERTLDGDGFAAVKDRGMNSREQLEKWRAEWEHLVNRHLERHGHAVRIDRRSLQEQGLDREPGVHLGYAAAEMTYRGAQSDRLDQLVDILRRNNQRGNIREDLAGVETEITNLEAEKAQQAEDRRAARQAQKEEKRQVQEELDRRAQLAAEQKAAAKETAGRPIESARAAGQASEQTAAAKETANRPTESERAARQAAEQQAAIDAEIKAMLDARRQATEEALRRVAALEAKQVQEELDRVASNKLAARTAEHGPELAAKLAKAERREDKIGNDREAAEKALQTLGRLDARTTPIGKEFAASARQQAKEVREEFHPKAAQPSPRPAPVGTPKPVRSGLHVVSGLTGVVTKLADFMIDFLAGAPAEPAPKYGSSAEALQAYLENPAARREQQLAKVAAGRAAEADEKAIDHIAEDIKAGRNLKSEDIKNLTRQHQEQIRHFGDQAVQQMVQEAQKRAQAYWKDGGRERERNSWD